MNREPLRIGLVGAGGISRRHKAAITALPHLAALVAVCDPREAQAQTLADSLPIPPAVFTDHRRMIEAGRIDAAIIAVPHFLHHPVARDFLEAGIPLLVEKPLSCTLEETRHLRALSLRHKVALVAGQTQRFNREAIWLKDWIQRDPASFGDLRTFDIQSWQNLPGYFRGTLGLSEGEDHWLLDGKRAGGGATISIAIHQLDLVRFVTGRNYVEVTASGGYDAPFYNGAESSVLALLRMDDGSTGVLHANYLAVRTPYNESMHLFGTHGTIVQHADKIGQYHGSLYFASDGNVPTKGWSDMYLDFATIPEDELATLSEDPFVNQLKSFATSLLEGTEPACNVSENFNTMACIQAVHESLTTGKAVQVAAA